MARRVLIADATATNRIAFKAALSSARYDVTAVASAPEAINQIETIGADLVVIEAGLPDDGGRRILRALAMAGPLSPPSLVIVDRDNTTLRADWLAAGATCALTRPVGRGWLLTNLRSLLRQQEVLAELARKVATATRLGFAEAPALFPRPPTLAVVASGRAAAGRMLRGLPDRLKLPIALRTPGQVLSGPHAGEGPDLLILSEEEDMDEVMWLLAELRSNPATRRTAILVECPPENMHCAARALDLGANAILHSGAGLRERALIVSRELERKRETDALRHRLDESLRMAARDHLTGLFNRRYAIQYLADLAERARVDGPRYGVMVIDLDHFKQINDRLGHSAGDEILTKVARTLENNLRDPDLVARFGGEEFLVILSDTRPLEAMAIAERLRAAVMTADIEIEGQPLGVTISIGVCCDGGSDTQRTIDRADAALYRAKREGRNKSRLALEDETMPPSGGGRVRPGTMMPGAAPIVPSLGGT